jgi:elongation factor Tu
MSDQPFLMPIEDVFAGVPGGGVVVTGHIERGIVRVGDQVELVGSAQRERRPSSKMEASRQLVDVGRAGEYVGILQREIDRLDVERGHVLATPGSIGSHRRLAARLHMRTKEEGGREAPFRDGYRPYFRLWTSSPGGIITLPRQRHEVKPGDDADQPALRVCLPRICVVSMSRKHCELW